MSDRVRMTSKTIFQNERITVFRAGGAGAGETGVAATVGDEFETDLSHAKELDRLGLADPINRSDLDGGGAALQPHHQVSVPELLADQTARSSSRADGPTIAEFVAAGYAASTYPPKGYAARSTPEEIAAAIEAGNSAGSNLELGKGEAAGEASNGLDLTGAGSWLSDANLHEGFGLGHSDDLDSKTNAELRDIAEVEGIDLGEIRRKDAIVAAIRAARTAKKD